MLKLSQANCPLQPQSTGFHLIMSPTVFALCCIVASCANSIFAQYGYGSSLSGRSGYSGRGGYAGNYDGAFGGQGPISSAIRSSHHMDYIDMPKSEDNAKESTIEVSARPLPLNIVFRSASSTLNLLHQHDPAVGDVQESSSEDEPHRLYHTVTKPIIQEVFEIIAPVRKITQEIKPVQEEIQTIVSRQNSDQQVAEKASKYADDFKQAAPMPSSAAPASGAVRTESSGLIKILKQVAYNDENKSGRQNTDDMYRSSSTPSFLVKENTGVVKSNDNLYAAMIPDYAHEAMLLPPTDYSMNSPKSSSRVQMMRKNRRMPPPVADPGLSSPFYSYQMLMEQYANAEAAKMQANEISSRNEIKIRKSKRPMPKFAHPYSAVQHLYESTFDDVYRSPAKLNRYVPLSEQMQAQQRQLASDEDLFNLVGYEEQVDLVDAKKDRTSKPIAVANKRLLSSFYAAINDNSNGNSARKQFDGDNQADDMAANGDSNDEQSAEMEPIQSMQGDDLNRKSISNTVDNSSAAIVPGDNEEQSRGNATAGNGAAMQPTERPAVEQTEPVVVAAEATQEQHDKRSSKKAEVLSSGKLAIGTATSGAVEASGHNVPSKATAAAVNANPTTSADQRK